MAWLSADRTAEIDQKIEELYKKMEIPDRYPDVSLVEIVEKNGLKVFKRDFGDHSGSIMGAIDFKHNKSKPVIYINKYKHPNNQRFTLAHELGHYVLEHRDQNTQFRIDFESDISSQNPKIRLQELEANYFAGALLMPVKAIKQQLGRNDLNKEIAATELERLKEYFKVSSLALKTRIDWIRRTDNDAKAI